MSKPASATVHKLQGRTIGVTQTGDRIALYAQAMLQELEQVMPDAPSFTREDLLYLPCFGAVATITRYRYVCDAVRYCIDRKWMYSVSRSELVLAGRRRSYKHETWEDYAGTIANLLPTRGTTWTVVSILSKWHDVDHHLTENTKRTMVREAVRTWLRRGIVKSEQFNVYERT